MSLMVTRSSLKGKCKFLSVNPVYKLRGMAAVFGSDAALNIGKLLDVPQGALGLRQSDAVFQHVRRLPVLIEELLERTAPNSYQALKETDERARCLAQEYIRTISK